MEYKGILTEEFAEGLRKEGADTVALLIYKNINLLPGESTLLRDIEIDINRREIFAIAGKTVEARKALELNFINTSNSKWYCFGNIDHNPGLNATSLLVRSIAQMCNLSEDELESTFLKENELT